MNSKRFGGKAGKDYDYFSIACPHYQELENKIAEIISGNTKETNLKVLEIGTGNGSTTKVIKKVLPDSSIDTIDNEKIMIEQAKNKLKEKDKINFILSDALKFLKKTKDNSYDLFVSAFTIHNFEKNYRRKVLKELYRVISPKGLFLNADKYALDNKEIHDEALNWQLNQFKEKFSDISRQDLIEDWTKHYLEDEKTAVIMGERKSINDMEKIGFKEIKIVFRKKMEAIVVARK